MYLLFDIGGTKTRIAVSRNGKTFTDPKIYPTPQNYEEGIERFVHTAKALAGIHKIKYAIGGVAGALINDNSSFYNIGKLPDWIEKPIKQDLERLLETQVILENDSALIGLGEISQMEQKPQIAVYITLSTGIGGVRIIDGRIDKSKFGFEPGRQIINFVEKKDGKVTEIKTWEDLAAGIAIEKKYGFKPEEIVEDKVWDELSEYTAIGLTNTILHWSPDIVILGGSMMNSLSLDRIEYYLKKYLTIFKTLPKLEKAKLEDLGGLYGALEIIKQQEL